jgi:hypothetical protein
MNENQVVDKETGEVTETPKQEETAVTKTEAKAPMLTTSKGLVLTSLDDMWRFAGYVVRSGLTPKGLERPEAVVIALQMGYELGLPPMQSIQNIAVINGRPCVWGDAVPGLIEASHKQEYGYPTKIGKRNPDGSFPDSYGYRYTTKRIGREEYSYEFTVADAKKASLWNKAGTWTFYPDRMLLNRARTFCLRDVFPDVLRGLVTDDEAANMVDADFTIEESKSRTEKLVDIVTNQPNNQKQAETAQETIISPETPKETPVDEKVPPESPNEAEPDNPVDPEPGKRGRPKKELPPDELTGKLGF